MRLIVLEISRLFNCCMLSSDVESWQNRVYYDYPHYPELGLKSSVHPPSYHLLGNGWVYSSSVNIVVFQTKHMSGQSSQSPWGHYGIRQGLWRLLSVENVTANLTAPSFRYSARLTSVSPGYRHLYETPKCPQTASQDQEADEIGRQLTI